MRTLGAAGSLILAVVLLASVSTATAQNKLEPTYKPLKPDGAGPFPAVMLLPGCGGFRSAQEKRAEELKGQGYVVVFVDFLAARKLPTVCGKATEYVKDFVKDIRDTITYLKAQPSVNPSAIGALGWSTGAGSIMHALYEEVPLQATVMFYPICRTMQPWKSSTPAIIFLGSLDDVNPPRECSSVIRDMPAGTALTVRTYEGARHSFDDPNLKSSMPFLGRFTVGHHPEATKQAWDEVKTFFATHLKK